MRGLPLAGKHFLIFDPANGRYTLAQLTGRPGEPVIRHAESVFETDRGGRVVRVLRALAALDRAAAARPRPGAARVTRILGYCDPLSLAPGETIRFMVSCEGHEAFSADLVRLICADGAPYGPGYHEEVVESPLGGRYRAVRQALYPGSCALIPVPEGVEGGPSLTVQAFIWPTTPERLDQRIVSRWSPAGATGFALLIGAAAECTLMLGRGRGAPVRVASGASLLPRRWYFVAASYDAASGEAWVLQQPLRPLPTVRDGGEARAALGPLAGGRQPSMIAIGAAFAGAEPERTEGHFNGKIDRPRIASRALARAEIEALKAAVPPARLAQDLLGAWDFSREISSTRVVDLSANGLHGRLRNFPTRAVTGHNWTGAAQRWRDAPDQYGAIHFHDDDIVDAGWRPSCALTLPEGLRSGIYAARLRAGEEEAYVPFFVRPPRGRASAPIAFLVPTATYMAYANYLSWADHPTIEQLYGQLWVAEADDLYLQEHRELGASTYDRHSDGSGIGHGSRLRPMLNIQPKRRFLWNLNADSHITAWLEAAGHGYDVITDEDLHAEGRALLAPYRVVITGTHPEYYSLEMLNALEAYLDHGGRLIYMGGNGFYWRIAFHPEQPGLIEVRRANGTRNWMTPPGEYYQAFDGEFGGTWREQGRPPNRLVGVGFAAEGFDRSSAYVRGPDSFDPRAAFVFEGIAADEAIGGFGSIGGGAAGLEVDRADPALGTPPQALVLASSVGHSDNYLLVLEDVSLNRPGLGGTEEPGVRADLVFFETPAGGAVFSTGSIAWAGSLAHDRYDNNVARLTGNVLNRFLDPKPFPD